MIVKTKSGSVYEFVGQNLSGQFTRVRRLPVLDGGVLRRDDTWVEIQRMMPVAVGAPMVLFLEPLGDGFATVRRTSAVTEIEP